MDDAMLDRIGSGMDVEDADGDAVGTVQRVFRRAPAAPPGEAYVKVHSGLPLLGTTYYVPASAVRDVKDDRVILTIDQTKVGEMGWDERPAWIRE